MSISRAGLVWKYVVLGFISGFLLFAILTRLNRDPIESRILSVRPRSQRPILSRLSVAQAGSERSEPKLIPLAIAEGKTNSETSFDEGLKDSFGFFRNIPNKLWRLARKVHEHALTRQRGNQIPARAGAWWQQNWEPNFSCLLEERIGKIGDGGKWVCDPFRIREKIADGKGCLVYSIGSNNEFSFEEAVFEQISNKCEIHTFDPTVGERPSNKPPFVKFHPWGLSSSASGSSKTLEQIRSELGHSDREIDIFKIDCEGCERSTAHEIFPTSVKNVVPIRQVMVEIHRADGKLFEIATQAGFAIYHKEPNIQFPMSTSPADYAVEYGFVKLNSGF